MRRTTEALTALVPVGVAALLIAFCLAGAHLYSSSSGSAALDAQLDETCRSASALTLPIPDDGARADRVEEIGSTVPFVEPARRWGIARPFLVTGSGLPRRLTLIWIDGIDGNVTPGLRPLAEGEIALSAQNMELLKTEIGGTVAVDGARLKVAQQFDDVPFSPIPSFWCGHPELLTPTSGGDPPPPFAIASLATIQSFGEAAAAFDEYRVVDQPLTLTDAAALEDGYATATSEWNSLFPGAPVGLDRNELGRVVARAVSVRTAVDRNLAPVTLTGVVAGGIVLLAAGVLVARDRRRELRLLAVRGLPPMRIAGYVAPRLGLAIAAGGLAGFALAWGIVSAFGPSSNLESGALQRAVIWVAVAMVVAVAVVSAVVGVVADGFADVRRQRVHRRWVALAVVIGLVAIAVIAFRRLDRNGGVRTFGVESRGGDLLAMGFPLFTLLAATALVALIIAIVNPRLRLSGARLRRTLRLGWRRVVIDTAPLVAVIVSVALAIGCVTTASALAAGSDRQLADKAAVYVGADLAIDVFDPVAVPADWEPRTTVISKVSVRADGDRAEMVGVDRSRFADVATLRSDGASQSLSQMLEAIAPAPAGQPLRAISVGADLGQGDVVEVSIPGTTDPQPVEVVATARFFPGKRSQVPLLVVDRGALSDVARFTREALLVRDPPDDAIQTIRDSGVRTGVILDAATAFSGSAYSALRWAYAPLATLGVLFAVVGLALQLLVVAARRGQRRVADAVMRRTGFDTRGLWWASVVESGVPLVVGAVVGVGAAAVAASLAVSRLDPLPALAPPAAFVMPWNVVVVTACVIPLWTAVVAFVVVRSTRSADPMRVFQGSAG